MKAIFSFLLVILFTFSNEIFYPLRCDPGYARVCGCTSCRCVKIPKCPKGQRAKCESTFAHSGCFCRSEK